VVTARSTLDRVLHLRVLLPADLTDAVVQTLIDDPAVTGVVVNRGAAVKPAGDLVLADVAREATNDVVDRLRHLQVHKVGSIHLAPVPTWLSQEAFVSEQEAPGSGADAVIWADVTQRAYEDSELTWTYLSFLVMATLLAAIAIVTDSQVLVIGAMVLGPEFGTVAALGVALVRRRPQLLWFAARTLITGFAVAIAIVTVLALVGLQVGLIDPAEVTGSRPGTAFIYQPSVWSFIVALIAAAAGVLSLTSSRVGGLSGVFISVTTVPAAGNIALGVALGDWAEVTGSGIQLVVNLAGMALAGALVLALQQVVWSRMSVYRAGLVARLRRRSSRRTRP
jgi:uncharacterized hydrophobic protein (TIGR00271 family)